MMSILTLILIVLSGVGFYFFSKYFLIKQSPMVVNIFKIVFVLIIVLVAYWNYSSIESKIILTESVEIRNKAVQERLGYISEAQIEYKKVKGNYAGDFEVLLNFLKNDSVVLVKMEGEVPDSLLGKEALALEMGIIIRDTTKTPVREQLFKENFNQIVDSMEYIPFGRGKKFTLAAGAVEKNKMQIPVFSATALLKDIYQGLETENEGYDMNDSLVVGSLEEPKTNGNW